MKKCKHNNEYPCRWCNRKSSLKQWSVYFKQGFSLIKARNKGIAQRKFERQQNGKVQVLKVERA